MPDSPSPPLDPPSQVTLKTAFTVCFAVAASAGLILFLYTVRWALTLAVGAALLAVAQDHVVQLLQRRWKLRRGVSILIVVTVAMALVICFGLILVPPAVRQARALVEEAPQLLARFQETRLFSLVEERFGVTERLKEAVNGRKGLPNGAIVPALSALGSALSGGAAIITLSFLTVFMLVFGRDQVRAVLSAAHPLFRSHYEHVLQKTYTAVGGYIGGLLVICGINATLTTAFLALVPRLPFFLPLGILSGASSLVPYAGPIVTGALITGVAMLSGAWWKGVATAIYFLLYGQLEGNVLGPVIFRRTVHLNPLVTLLSVLFLAELMGVVGAVLAVPIVASAQIVVRELLVLRRERWLVQQPAPAPQLVTESTAPKQ